MGARNGKHKRNHPGFTNLSAELNKYSAQEDLAHAISVILEKKLKPNQKDRAGMTLLHIATEAGNVTQCKILLHIGALPNLHADITQTSPLIFAASNGHIECVKILLEAQANVDGQDLWGNTALFKACVYNHLETARLLLDHGADPNLPNKWGALPLQYAAHQGHVHVVKALIDGGADIALHLEHRVPAPLSAAASRCHQSTIDILLAAGAPVNYSLNENGKTALLHVLKYPSHHYSFDHSETVNVLACIQMLIKAGAIITDSCISFIDLTHDAEHYLSTLQALSCSNHHRELLKAMLFMPMLDSRKKTDFSQALRLLYSVGFSLSPQEFVDILKDKEESILIKNHRQCLEHMSNNPRPLMSTCRLAIRETLKPNVTVCVDRLPLPSLMKDYVAIKNHTHFDYIHDYKSKM